MKCTNCGTELHDTAYEDDNGVYCWECEPDAPCSERKVCDVCGALMADGFVGDDEYVCRGCFEEWMDDRFPAGWRDCDDDGCGGYYEWYDVRECEWCGTGIYWTEWE